MILPQPREARGCIAARLDEVMHKCLKAYSSLPRHTVPNRAITRPVVCTTATRLRLLIAPLVMAKAHRLSALCPCRPVRQPGASQVQANNAPRIMPLSAKSHSLEMALMFLSRTLY